MMHLCASGTNKYNNMETRNSNSRKLFLKGVVIVCTAICMLVPVLMVNGVVDEREDLSEDVTDEIARSWGGRQVISAPEIRMPVPEKESRDNAGPDYYFLDSYQAAVAGKVSVEMLRRSIYEVPAYRAELEVAGAFVPDDTAVSLVRRTGKCSVFLQLDGLKGIEDRVILKVEGKEYPFHPADDGLQAVIPAWMVREGVPLNYTFSLKIKGIESIRFVPNQGRFSLRLESDYPSPGFCGAFLPDERTVDDSGFTAEWQINEMNLSDSERYASKFGVDFVVPVSQYQQTSRAIKYFFLIICLVFTGIFLVEAVSGRYVNIVQYIVTGFSLCLFYLLLLAFSEYLAFGLAYLIAAVLTVVSLGAYFMAILRSRIAYMFTLAMAVIYGFIYVLLNMETGSLLAGSLALFLILCVIMYFTRNLNKTKTPEVMNH